MQSFLWCVELNVLSTIICEGKPLLISMCSVACPVCRSDQVVVNKEPELLKLDTENKTPAETDKIRQFLFDITLHTADLQSVAIPNPIAAVRVVGVFAS